MIQRIQTLYLALAALTIMGMYKFAIFTFTTAQGAYQLYACHIQAPETLSAPFKVYPMAVLPLLIAILCIVAIFSFKNRVKQIKICLLAYTVLVTLALVMGIYIYKLNNLPDAVSNTGFGLVLPLVAYAFIVLAKRAIKKDDDLVKSADRIR